MGKKRDTYYKHHQRVRGGIVRTGIVYGLGRWPQGHQYKGPTGYIFKVDDCTAKAAIRQ